MVDAATSPPVTRRWRPHLPPRLVDGILAVLLTAGTMSDRFAQPRVDDPSSPTPVIQTAVGSPSIAQFAVGLLLPQVMWWRRSRPLPMLLVALVVPPLAYVVLGTVPGQVNESSFLVAVAVTYALGAYELDPRRRYVGVAAVLVVSPLFGLLPRGASDAVGSDALRPVTLGAWRAEWALPQFGLCIGLFLIAYLLGRAADLRRSYVRELGLRLEQVEAMRAAEARTAVAEERTRIAHELHDVVAHHVSVMTVQAAAARAVLADDPGAAGEAMDRVAATGREALDEMRSLVSSLRVGPAADVGRAPTPGLDAIDALVEQVRSTGLTVELEQSGTPRRASRQVGLAAYRIIQESLTNVLRHSGSTSAHVALRWGADRLHIDVRDHGRGPGTAAATAGHGVTGMRERATALGGSLTVGAAPGGGFQVVATLPYGDAAPTPEDAA